LYGKLFVFADVLRAFIQQYSSCVKSVILFLLVMFIACNNNTSAPDDDLVQDNLIAKPDSRKFILMAAEASMTELSSGRFASGHATDQRLKSYGYEMIKDHEDLLKQIKLIAQLRNITLPDTVNIDHQQLLQILRTKAGNSFDSIYMAEIIKHQKELSHLYDKIRSSSDTALASYAARAIPVITNHLLRLITIRDSIYIKMIDIH
jgi:putative membrane protein